MPLIGMAGSSVMMLPLPDALRTAIDAGFEAFELFGETPQCVCDEVSADVRKEAKAMAQSAGIALALHSPFTSLNIAALNKGIREESLRQTLAAIDMCGDIGGRSAVIYNGSYILSQISRDRAPEAFDVQWELNLKALKKAAKRAEERGVNLCLENIAFEPNIIDRNADDLLKIRSEVASPALFFCIDIGHARLSKALPEVIQKIGPLARHIHFTDNFGQKDDHVIIGKGNFDYTPHLDFFRNFDGIITLEVFHLGKDPKFAKESLAYIRKILAGANSHDGA